MEDNNNVVTATETAEKEVQQENVTPEVEDKKEKTYSRAEVNKMINAEREKLKEELLKEAEVKKSEAEKLAKMDTEQKLNYKTFVKKKFRKQFPVCKTMLIEKMRQK